jgi:tetratricopeptide (TPR) repeat protein
MQGRWQEAVAANRSLLEGFPNDVDAYNRLGRAYMELGEYAQAKEAYARAIELDSYNTIAQKNLNRLSHLDKSASTAETGFQRVEPQHFIEETGKAGLVNLYRLAPPEVLAKTVAGGMVNLKIDGLNLIVESARGEYLGQVEPRHGQRLAKLMEGGNQYNATIVSSAEDMVAVMVREVYLDPTQVGRPSFPPRGTESLRPYAGDRIIRRELEYEESLLGEPSYTIVGGDEGDAELLTEESADTDEEAENEE